MCRFLRSTTLGVFVSPYFAELVPTFAEEDKLIFPSDLGGFFLGAEFFFSSSSSVCVCVCARALLPGGAAGKF